MLVITVVLGFEYSWPFLHSIFSLTSQASMLQETVIAVPAENNMIQQLQSQNGACLLESFSHRLVFLARVQVAAGVVMGDDYSSTAVLDCLCIDFNRSVGQATKSLLFV